MRTRRESAEEKRKGEEEIKRVEREKREKNRFKRRKLIGPHDLPVDRNLPKIYIDPADVGEAEVKVEIKEEAFEVVEDDGGFEAFQQDELIEEEDTGVDEETPMVIYPADLGEAEIKIEIKDEQIEVIEDQLEQGDGVIGAVQQDDEVAQEKMGVDQETLKKAFLVVLPLVDQRDVFRCRLVNMQWRGIVDDFIEDSVVLKPYDDKAYLEKLRRSPYSMCPLPQFRFDKITYKFEDEAEVEKFNEAMKGHMESGLSPFVGGAIVIFNNLSIKSSSVLSPATQLFLEKFGVYIRRLGIIHENEEAEERGNLDIVGFVNFVKKCSHFVPNLEKLTIKWHCCVDVQFKRRLADLKATLYRNELFDRMPKLNKLTSLQFDFDDNFVSKIFADIMIKSHYQSQLKQLSLNWIEEFADLQVDNVKELNITFLMLLELKEVKLAASVEKLTFLSFELNLKDDMAQIFPHLRYLRLFNCYLPRCLMGLNANWQRANIYTLELMEFDVEQCIPPNLNIAFPHLRHLIIRGGIISLAPLKGGTTEAGMELHQLFNGGTTYRTNLWEILPELEVFTFQFRAPIGLHFKNFVETRDGYQKYIQKKQIV